MGANLEGTRGRLLGVGPLGGRLLGFAASWQPAVWTSGPQEGGLLPLILEGRSRPRCLEIPYEADEATYGHLLRQMLHPPSSL